MKIAHIADLHLDVAHRDDAVNAFRFAVETAIERRCDALVLAGDVFDRRVSVDDASPLLPALRIVRDAAHFMPVIIVKGNHDVPGALDVFGQLREPHPIIVADTPVVVDAGGIRWSLLPYPTKAFLMTRATGSQDDTDQILAGALRSIIGGFAAAHAGAASPLPHVLVYHGNVSGSVTATGQVMLGGDVIISAADLESSGADYVALGHIHARQTLGTRCHYPGSMYHCNFGEVEPKFLSIVDVERGAQPRIEAVRLPSRPKVVIDLAPDGTATEPYAPNDLADADVKVRVRMTEEEFATFDEPAMRAVAERAGAHSVIVERIVIPRERIRSEAVAASESLADKVTEWGRTVDVDIPSGVLDKAAMIEAEGGVA